MASSRRAAPFATAIYARVDDRALGVRCIEGVGRFVFIERLERGGVRRASRAGRRVGGWGPDLSNPWPISWLRIRFRSSSWACWPGLQTRYSACRRRQSRSAQAQNHDSSIRLHNECACAQAGRQVTPMCGVNARFHAGGERLTVGLDTFAKEGNVGSASRTCRERSVMRSIRRGGG